MLCSRLDYDALTYKQHLPNSCRKCTFYYCKSSNSQPFSGKIKTSVSNVDCCLTGRRLWDVHVCCLQRHRGVELEWDVNCQRYSRCSHFVTLHTLHTVTPTLHLRAPQTTHSLPIRAQSVAMTRKKSTLSTVSRLNVDQNQSTVVV